MADVAVVGVRHERPGEAAAAFVVLRADVTWEGPGKLLAHLDGLGLATANRPAEWHVLDELPRAASGNIQKHKLAGAV